MMELSYRKNEPQNWSTIFKEYFVNKGKEMPNLEGSSGVLALDSSFEKEKLYCKNFFLQI